MSPSPELLHGTLDTLVLKTLTGGRRHGYAIARAIEEATEGVVDVEEGSLYPALYRMERKGWVEAEWGVSELGPPREVLPPHRQRTASAGGAGGRMDPLRRGDLARSCEPVNPEPARTLNP